MQDTASPYILNSHHRVKKSGPPILKAGAVAGTLDIATACGYYYFLTGCNPADILRYVASGVFGKAALTGGALFAVAGLILHYIIAFSFTIFFFRLYPSIRVLSQNRIVTAIVYGILVWMVMNLVVVPLSRIPVRPFDARNAVINVVILICCIGIPLSFMARSFYGKRAVYDH